MQRTTDMTVGGITAPILKFAFPLILTNLGQHLYMIVDAAIVGKGVGVMALASVGAADWIYWLILWAVAGFCQGFSVLISQHFGKGDLKSMNRCIAASAVLSVGVGIFLTALGLSLTSPLLTVLDTPLDIFEGAKIYLMTMISGTLIVTAYNMSAGILRALGDGKTPLIAMAVAAVMNVGLDLVLVLLLKMGVFGAALASVMSQLFSFIYCAVRITKTDCIKIEREMLRPNFPLMGRLLSLGAPIAFQYMVIALGGIILQSTINLQGSIFVAGFTAVNKLYGLLESTAISLGAAFSTFFSQCYGAKSFERVKRGMTRGVIILTLASLVITVITLIFKEQLLELFLDISTPEGPLALNVGIKYLLVITVPLSILYLLHLYKNALQSFGVISWCVASGFGEFFVRVFMGKTVVSLLGPEVLYYVEPCAWVGGLVFVIIPYYALKNKILPSRDTSGNKQA